MEGTLAATTPDVPIVAPDGGQPPPEQVAVPEGQQLPPEGLAPESEQEQYFLKAETGTVYKTPEAAAAGIAEKDRFIQRLLEERGQFQQPQPAAQPPVEVDPFTDPRFISTVERVEKRLMQKPEWRAAGAQAIREQAEITAIGIMEATEATLQETRTQQRQTEALSFFDQHKQLLTSQIGNEVFDRAQREGRQYSDPWAHKDAVELECYRRGIDPKTLMAGGQRPAGTAGVNGAVQYQAQSQQRIFGNSGAGAPPPAEPLPEYVQQAVADAQSKGMSAEDVERIKSIAMGVNVNRFNKSRGFNQ